MIGTIWYNNFTKALLKLEDVKKEYRNCGITVIKEIYQGASNSLNMTVLFENGDKWYLKRAYDLSCETRTNISYIESTIPSDIVENIIKHCAFSSPYCKYQEHFF